MGRFSMVACMLVLMACGNGEGPMSPSDVVSARQSLDGRTAYEAHCASCHREGTGDAPVTGEPSDWSGRSQLWIAVLSEHVKNGYLQMPARGGEQALSDADVEAAVEYMLLLTYPDLPRD